MEIRHLRTFKEVAELESVSLAAKQLYLSQAQVSRTIMGLESELGVRLFDRTSSGLHPNPAGRYFYERVVSILTDIEDSATSVRRLVSDEAARVKVGLNSGTFASDLLVWCAREIPDVRVVHYSLPRHDLRDWLDQGLLDFAICAPPFENVLSLSVDTLRVEPIVAIFPAGHRLEGKPVVSLNELTEENFVSLARGYGARDSVDFAFQALGASPHCAIETADVSSILRCVEGNLGVATIPLTLALSSPRFASSYSRLAEPVSGTVSLSWRKSAHLTSVQERFRTAVRSYFASLPSLDPGIVES